MQVVRLPCNDLQEFEEEIPRFIHLVYPGNRDDFREKISEFDIKSEPLVNKLEIKAAFKVTGPKIRAVTIKNRQNSARSEKMRIQDSKKIILGYKLLVLNSFYFVSSDFSI